MRGFCAYTDTPKYARLHHVMASSWHAHNAGSPLTVQRYEAPEARGPDDITAALLECLRLAAAEVAKACEPLVILDADLLIRAPLEEVWDRDFDVAVTVRSHEQRYNTGIVFVRPTPEGVSFFHEWNLVAQAMCAADDEGKSQRKRWGAVDQAALAWLLGGHTSAVVVELNCAEWNACQQHWVGAEAPKVVHIKGMLRRLCLNGETTAMGLGNYVREWMLYE